MAIGDGEKILIRFTQPLVGDLDGNEDHFNISFQEYNFVPNGTLQNTIRPVEQIDGYTSIVKGVNFETGEYINTVYNGGSIILEEASNG